MIMFEHDSAQSQRSAPILRAVALLHRIGARLTVVLALIIGVVLVPVLATSASAASTTTPIVTGPAPIVTGPGPVIWSLSGDAPNTTVGAIYSYQYTAKHEGAPTACALAITSATQLPPGLSFNNSTCTWSGQATKAGTYTFFVTTSNGPLGIYDTIVVTGSTVTRTTITGDAPNALVRLPYSFTYTTNSAKGCLPVVLGSLPPGLTFKGSTCTVSGTPTKTGTYRFAVVTADERAYVADTIAVVLPGGAPVVPPRP